MEHKIFVNVGGKMQEISPVSIGDSINIANTETDNRVLQQIGDAVEIPFICEYTEEFFEQMKKEFSVVDITDWPAHGIKALRDRVPYIQKLVTRNPKHYLDLQMEDGFACVAGDYETLFDLPLILDKKGKIKAAQVEFVRKGGGMDADE